ncbi:MAG: hypothetical protein PUG04_02790 [Lachnospiraceae bacterium]|nr:hypothetical protein [Lachnospiraceae bacterium]
MSIFVYKKLTDDDTETLGKVVDSVRATDEPVYIIVENSRSFHLLDQAVYEKYSSGDGFIVSSLSSLGANSAEITGQLNIFIQHGIYLAICDHYTTYIYGRDERTNMAVLQTIAQSIAGSTSTSGSASHRKSAAGRPRAEFPDGWEELYRQWSDKEISSGEFLKKSGLKKATFYNMINEYRDMLKESEAFIRRYNAG